MRNVVSLNKKAQQLEAMINQAENDLAGLEAVEGRLHPGTLLAQYKALEGYKKALAELKLEIARAQEEAGISLRASTSTPFFPAPEAQKAFLDWFNNPLNGLVWETPYNGRLYLTSSGIDALRRFLQNEDRSADELIMMAKVLGLNEDVEKLQDYKAYGVIPEESILHITQRTGGNFAKIYGMVYDSAAYIADLKSRGLVVLNESSNRYELTDYGINRLKALSEGERNKEIKMLQAAVKAVDINTISANLYVVGINVGGNWTLLHKALYIAKVVSGMGYGVEGLDLALILGEIVNHAGAVISLEDIGSIFKAE
jgi:hypothetical protein